MQDDIEVLTLRTGDGLALEAELARPAGSPRAAVVLAHPHPLHGGSMRSSVISELVGALPGRGMAVLRFNFRGVGASEGTHGGGADEHADVVAAVDVLAEAVEGAGSAVPLVLAGWSFGADVSLAVTDPRLAGWFLIAAPLRVLPTEAFVASTDPRPTWFAAPDHDQFRPPDGVREITASWAATSVRPIPGADHFLEGRAGAVADQLDEFVTALAGARA